jgi:hypothetical protein
MDTSRQDLNLRNYVIIGTAGLRREQELNALFAANEINWVFGEGSIVHQILVPRPLADKAARVIKASHLNQMVTVYTNFVSPYDDLSTR